MFYPISLFFVVKVNNDDEYGNEDGNDILKSDLLGHNCMAYNKYSFYPFCVKVGLANP